MVDWEKQGSGERRKEIQQKHGKLAASFVGRLPPLTRAHAHVRDAAVGLTRQEGQKLCDSSTLRRASFSLLLGAAGTRTAVTTATRPGTMEEGAWPLLRSETANDPPWVGGDSLAGGGGGGVGGSGGGEGNKAAARRNFPFDSEVVL